LAALLPLSDEDDELFESELELLLSDEDDDELFESDELELLSEDELLSDVLLEPDDADDLPFPERESVL
jgi:hypothetical protein